MYSRRYTRIASDKLNQVKMMAQKDKTIVKLNHNNKKDILRHDKDLLLARKDIELEKKNTELKNKDIELKDKDIEVLKIKLEYAEKMIHDSTTT